jgi:hypothetical protein
MQTMKSILTILLLTATSFWGFSQTTVQQSAPQYFAQCMLTITDEAQFNELQEDLRQNPYVALVRLDWHTKRAFLLSKDITSLDETQFLSWLGVYASNATCIQVGLHGIDQVKPYPFTDCENQ